MPLSKYQTIRPVPGLGRVPGPAGDRRRGKIGLLGGSFNPAHDGHLHVSRQALKHLGLDQIWWLVTPQNPLKDRKGMAPEAVRRASAQQIAREDRRIRVTTLEHAFGTQYTADTMVVLKRRFPKARFVFLIGADNLIQLPRWDRWERLMTTVPIAVFDRAPYSVRALAGLAARRYRPFRRVGNRCFGLAQATPPAWVFLPIRKHAASATDLRARGWGALESKAQSDAERNGEDDS